RVPPFIDLRGTCDTHGHQLHATVLAAVDSLAAAAGLVMGKTAKTPAVLVRGFPWEQMESHIGVLLRTPETELFLGRCSSEYWAVPASWVWALRFARFARVTVSSLVHVTHQRQSRPRSRSVNSVPAQQTSKLQRRASWRSSRCLIVGIARYWNLS